MSATDAEALTDYAEEISVDWLAIAQVLARAHRAAEAKSEPNEARMILHLAHTFADELAAIDRRFDREQFIQAAHQAAMEDQS